MRTTRSLKRCFGSARTANASPVTEVRDGHKLNEKFLNEYLLSQKIISANIASIRQFSHGQSNPTYIMDVGVGNQCRKLVIRKQPSGKLYEVHMQ